MRARVAIDDVRVGGPLRARVTIDDVRVIVDVACCVLHVVHAAF